MIPAPSSSAGLRAAGQDQETARMRVRGEERARTIPRIDDLEAPRDRSTPELGVFSPTAEQMFLVAAH
jgi:hypothetical protein